MIDLIKNAQATTIACSKSQSHFGASAIHSQHDLTALEYYEQKILKPDIAFSVVFALFIVTAGLTAALLTVTACVAFAGILVASLGLIYGIADIGEDVKLLGIFKHARATIAHPPQATDPADTAARFADAAEVDAANALTRVKISAVAASVIGGLVLFLLFLGLDKLAARRDPPPISDQPRRPDEIG